MSYLVTKYPHGTFCWADVSSTNIEATKTFMCSLLGWTNQDIPMGKGMNYTMFALDGHVLAGGAQMPETMAGVPSVWNNYVSVENVDMAVEKAVSLGATISMPAMDVQEAGRMAGIKDPTGAYVYLWQAGQHIGAGIVNTIGAMGWNELYTLDIAKSQEFYGQLFGWTFQPDDNGYVIIKNNGRMNGGMMQITPEMVGMQPCWIPYFSVKNSEESNAKVVELDGKVMMTKAIDAGKISGIADPTGAMFMLIESATPPEEWVE